MVLILEELSEQGVKESVIRLRTQLKDTRVARTLTQSPNSRNYLAGCECESGCYSSGCDSCDSCVVCDCVMCYS